MTYATITTVDELLGYGQGEALDSKPIKRPFHPLRLAQKLLKLRG